MTTKQTKINVRLDTEVHEMLLLAARVNGQSVAALAQELISDALDRYLDSEIFREALGVHTAALERLRDTFGVAEDSADDNGTSAADLAPWTA
jgi:hypothetical protein